MTKEEQILSLLKSSELEIDSEGRIWRTAKRMGAMRGPQGEYLKGTRVIPCKRVRAEYSTRQGYLLVAVQLDGKRVCSGAHRIVWTHANGPIPVGLTINHINGEKADNRLENLELASYSEQRIHALTVLKVRRNHPKGSLHPKTFLSEADVVEIRRLRSEGMIIRVIAEKYGMKKKAISSIVNRRTWKHV